MTLPTTFVITMCIFGFASSDMGRELAKSIQCMRVQTFAANERQTPPNRECGQKPPHVHEHHPTFQLDRRDSNSGLVTELKSDERFWKVFRDFDPDADSMLAWQEFQAGSAGQD